MTAESVDAVVVGAGHNGLVAANLLADAGWEVLVCEATDSPGGAVRSAEITAPGFQNDLFSAFYPLAAASPVLAGLDLPAHGLRWRHAPAVLAHVTPDDRCTVLHRDPARTAADLDAAAPGDGEAWLALVAQWQRIRDPLLETVLRPFPPLRGAPRLLRALGAAEGLRFARMVVQPVRGFAREHFRGEGAGLLLAGNALHTDLGPDAAGSAVFGWLLSMLGQDVGFPVPEGGAGRLTDALVARLRSRGGRLDCDRPVGSVVVRDGRARGVRDAEGNVVVARRAVLADVAAPLLYRELVGEQHLPARFVRDLVGFEWDTATVKLDWALDGPVPWTAEGARGAGTVHLGADADGLRRYTADLTADRLPDEPFLLFGQMTTADPSRSPAGTESAWAYTHVPRGLGWTESDLARHADRIEQTVERVAPGFRALIRARHVAGPPDLQRRNPNLVDGAINGGTAAVHQQLVFRPVPGLGRADTPVDGLFLAGSSAHPGGAVHGGAGANAARAALAASGLAGPLYRRAVQAAHRRLYRED
ncbi:phytoene desaturase family protein [Pseudonocardia oroxyli]|uniref:Phytoene dehydrogenase-related protein n=1 Tax=Pseudonocardia oroxyli TaxID=366584 RepID=A0A1G7G9Z4_PSEOR|nr:NAD(P)/FAD-dependent oxidoreductase [Pseudonocardia oroxyli]SDE84895.1 Phytoene dehydrogenase-related protein [Pseudonocardia oroxyli]